MGIGYDREKAKSEYAQKLRDPRWQKMRLKIMERDEFSCQYCGDSESTLNVHHLDYIQGNDPWEYDDSWLVTLCEACHEEESRQRPMEEKSLLHVLRVTGFRSAQIVELLIAFHRVGPLPEPTISGLCWAIQRREVLLELEDRYFQYLKERRQAKEAVTL